MAKTLNKPTAYPKNGPMPSHPMDHSSEYPTVRLEGPDDLDLPDDGVLTIKYHKIHEAVTNKDKPNETYSCTLEVKHLVSVKKDAEVSKPASSHSEAGDALDKLAAKKYADAENVEDNGS